MSQKGKWPCQMCCNEKTQWPSDLNTGQGSLCYMFHYHKLAKMRWTFHRRTYWRISICLSRLLRSSVYSRIISRSLQNYMLSFSDKRRDSRCDVRTRSRVWSNAQGVLPSFVCCTPSECSISPIIILRRGVTKLSMLALNLLGSPGRCGSPASAPQTADPRSVLSGSRVCFWDVPETHSAVENIFSIFCVY